MSKPEGKSNGKSEGGSGGGGGGRSPGLSRRTAEIPPPRRTYHGFLDCEGLTRNILGDTDNMLNRFIFYNLNCAPIDRTTNKTIVEVIMAACIAYGRAKREGKTAEKAHLSAIGEAYGWHIPMEWQYDQAMARTEFVRAAHAYLSQPNMPLPADFNVTDMVPAATPAGGVFPPATAFGPDSLRYYMDRMLIVCRSLAVDRPVIGRQIMVDATIAFCCLGSVSEAKAQKLTDELRLAFGDNAIIVNGERIKTIWDHYSRFSSSRVASNVLRDWDNWLPEQALRLRNLVTQAQWGKLSMMMFVERAMMECRDFPWGRFLRIPIYKAQMTAFEAARNIVAGDKYYGFNNNLDAVSASKYRDLGSACILMLNKMLGDNHARSYAGFKRRVPNHEMIEGWIEAASHPLLEDNDPELQANNDYVEGLRTRMAAWKAPQAEA